MIDRDGFEFAAGEPGIHQFLLGADMDPTAVLAAHPGARFVARARLASEGDEVWGILVRLASHTGGGGAGDEREVVTDDGRRFRAKTTGGERPAGEPGAILAAARYWELPPSYVRQLPRPADVD